MKPVRKLLVEYQWFLLGGIWVAGLVLGYVGFIQYSLSNRENSSPLSIVYKTLRLITLDSGDITGEIPWELEVARFLLPALVAYTSFQALALLFREQFQYFRLLFLRDHMIICGLSNKGLMLAQGFHHKGNQIVIIERDRDNDYARQCKDMGMIVLFGDATGLEMLRRARLQYASHVIAVCDDDGINVKIAAASRKIINQHLGGTLTCTIHIYEPQLCELLKTCELAENTSSTFRLNLFNVFERGSQLMLQESQLLTGQTQPQDNSLHFLVIGLGKFGESLVINSVRSWRKTKPSPDNKIKFTVVDPGADWKVESLCFRYPVLRSTCEFVTHSILVQHPKFQSGEFLYNENGICDIDAMFVCLDNDSLGLNTALVLLKHTHRSQIPIIVRMRERIGLAALLNKESGSSDMYDNVHAFGLLERTCTPDLLLGGTVELLAQAIHAEYVRSELNKETPEQTNTGLLNWADLPDRIKEKHRHQADHIGSNLKAINYQITPMIYRDEPQHEFNQEEIEILAKMEHKRCCDESSQLGWVDPAEKNAISHAGLQQVDWDALSEEDKNRMRDSIRQLPAFLSMVGFQIESSVIDDTIH